MFTYRCAYPPIALIILSSKKSKAMRKALVIIPVLLCVIQLTAQPYRSAIGGRLGYPAGIPSFKHNFTKHHTLEALAEWYYGGLQIVGLYEYHGAIKEVDGLRLYGGGGLGVGFYKAKPYWSRGNKEHRSAFGLTLHPIVGLEYTLRQAPVNFSIDYKPAIDVFRWWGYGSVGLGIRYTFGKT